MCGIWALFGSYAVITKQIANVLKVSYRGPDAFRIESNNHLFPHCCLAFHRLAIVDDLYGMQPMRVNMLPHLWLIYNGEIYNHKRVGFQHGFNFQTQSDGEVILHLYHEGGAEYAAARLDGVFAFCILDTEKKQVHIGRDTYGVRPAFKLLSDNGVLAICSEAKGARIIIQREETEGADAEVYAVNGLVHLTESMENAAPVEASLPSLQDTLRAIKWMTSGESKVTLIEQKQFQRYRCYAQIRVGWGKNFWQKSLQCENLAVTLTAAVKKRMMSDRRIGCLLSGGLDSSLIAALAVNAAKNEFVSYPIQTFSIGMEGSPDLAAAQKVADHIGSEHHRSRPGYHEFNYTNICSLADRAPRVNSMRSGFVDSELDVGGYPVGGAKEGVQRWRLVRRRHTWLRHLQKAPLRAKVSDKEMAEAAEKYPLNTPTTKEACYYRQIFESYYPDHGDWISYMWMPKWTEATDPSARTLRHYKS
ncbi:PREDICTED: asparagine synthetase [glutamine-hydrolyzing]-like [Priapulus caudatus]|uniref:Glutamine-dependent asparagine synthetase n=1 Tax=Priapulus caudatus TaxID=37621 RepID=A0ABM1EFE2_PRICU|nr:PREDICTED: asparagine synthetase [glutamine-hydrolyzing]-like [Priapulus caudatus]